MIVKYPENPKINFDFSISHFSFLLIEKCISSLEFYEVGERRVRGDIFEQQEQFYGLGRK